MKKIKILYTNKFKQTLIKRISISKTKIQQIKTIEMLLQSFNMITKYKKI